MTRILIVKLSSMGDIIHTFPALSDLKAHFPQIEIDWLVDESFSALPALHPAVRRVWPFPLRRFKKQGFFSCQTRQEWGQWKKHLRALNYDVILEVQGLLKSAFLGKQIGGILCGYDRKSIREPLAALFYDKTYSVARDQGAIARIRQLCAQAFGYSLETPPLFGLTVPPRPAWLGEAPYVVCLHGTSRPSKEWPLAHWITLGQFFEMQGLRCLFPWGSEAERQRSIMLAAALPSAEIAPPLDFQAASSVLGHAHAVIGVDTGLTHLANALNVPTVALFTDTFPHLTGIVEGSHAQNLGMKGHLPTPNEVVACVTGWRLQP